MGGESAGGAGLRRDRIPGYRLRRGGSPGGSTSKRCKKRYTGGRGNLFAAAGLATRQRGAALGVGKLPGTWLLVWGLACHTARGGRWLQVVGGAGGSWHMLTW